MMGMGDVIATAQDYAKYTVMCTIAVRIAIFPRPVFIISDYLLTDILHNVNWTCRYKTVNERKKNAPREHCYVLVNIVVEPVLSLL